MKPGSRQPGLQDQFLNLVRRSKAPVTIYLVKGVKLQGVITWFDAFSLLIRREGTAQLVYKHGISTIHAPSIGNDLAGLDSVGGGSDGLQDIFLGAAVRQREPMTMFLVNGVMLQGRVGGFDQFVILLERQGQWQMVYKHAVSTLQPAGSLDLGGPQPGEGDGA